jgi:hypothetical protein
MENNKNKKVIFNKHFLTMISIFVLIIVTVLTFVSFIESALKQDKNFVNNDTVKK